ncbi:MAG: tetratricopeptide repeat protein [Cytophagales bacterium]|nr:tetratricopeptide repeat protein [Cytophagales bacterium]
MYKICDYILNKLLLSKVVMCTIIGVMCILMLQQCSPYNRSKGAMLYHNTTSHYNAYFLARERMKELETELFTADKNNYNKILNIYPVFDTTYSNKVKDKLDKIIKNTSLPIQWHKFSHWVDDCYLVLGKCRYYDSDLENSITTFRFINNKFNDDAVKHDALIWLMKVYMKQGDWYMARQWGDYMEEELLLPKNIGKLSLANGHYYIKQNDLSTAYEKMKIGVKYVKPRQYRAKMWYVLGQLAQLTGKEKDAYNHYRMSAKQTKDYEMWFYAKINMAQLKELKNEKDIDKILRFYRKQLKDIKNTDYKDKIYYEIGMFYMKREKIDDALENFKLSARNSKNNPFVKSFAYLRLADTYYDKLQKFETAKDYYDSTVLFLDKELPEYPRAYRRKKVLAEFVEQLRIVRKEDSLQRLARMDSAALSKLIDKWIKEEDDKVKEQIRQQRKLARQAEAEANAAANAPSALGALGTPTLGGAKTESNGKWYFYNKANLEMAKQDFLKKWGNRPLEDNWRRKNKPKEENSDDPDAPQVNKVSDSLMAVSKNIAQKAKKIEDDAASNNNEAKRKQYYEQIPMTKVKMDTSMAKKGRALHRMGKIYDQNLEEYKNAAITFDRYIEEYPDHEEKTPQALYFNYLIFKNKTPDEDKMLKYKDMLLDKFPKSLYAKLVLNPNYLVENYLLGENIKKQYRDAFELYKNQKYLQCQAACDTILKNFPDNEYTERLALLKALVVGATQSMDNYQLELKKYIAEYKTANTKPYAQHLLQMAEKISKTDSTGAIKQRVVYDLDLDMEHYFCAVVPLQQVPINELIDKIKKYNEEYYTDYTLSLTTNDIGDSTVMIKMEKFKNKIQGLNYYEKQKGKSSPLQNYPQANISYFVITPKNFELMSGKKGLKSYLQFFSKNY